MAITRVPGVEAIEILRDDPDGDAFFRWEISFNQVPSDEWIVAFHQAGQVHLPNAASIKFVQKDRERVLHFDTTRKSVRRYVEVIDALVEGANRIVAGEQTMRQQEEQGRLLLAKEAERKLREASNEFRNL
jgi:hypothetical protein